MVSDEKQGYIQKLVGYIWQLKMVQKDNPPVVTASPYCAVYPG